MLSEPSWVPGLPLTAEENTARRGGGAAAVAEALISFRTALRELGVSDTVHERFFVKTNTALPPSRFLRWFLAANPAMPWIMTFRDPAEIVASHSRYCEDDILALPAGENERIAELQARVQEMAARGGAVASEGADAMEEYERVRRSVAIRCTKALARWYREVLELLQAGQAAAAASSGGGAVQDSEEMAGHAEARRWSNVHPITISAGGEGCAACPAAHGSLMLLDYASMPERFFVPPPERDSTQDSPPASVVDAFGLAPLPSQDAVRARYISRYYSKSVFDVPHAFALRGSNGGSSVTAPPQPKRPVPEWIRKIVRQHFGQVRQRLQHFLS